MLCVTLSFERAKNAKLEREEPHQSVSLDTLGAFEDDMTLHVSIYFSREPRS